jgi:hypothetical protein
MRERELLESLEMMTLFGGEREELTFVVVSTDHTF